MVNSIGGARALVMVAALAGVLVDPHARADDGSAPNPYGTLVKGPFPATPPADVSPLARGLATRAGPAGAKQATDDTGPTSDVIFAAPTFPDARGGGGGAFVKRQPSEPAEDVIFAAPTPSAPALKGDDGRSTPVGGATTSAPASMSSSGPVSTVANGEGAPVLTPPEVAELKRQARERLTTGSIAAARALLEQAVAGGDAEAQYMLARTFDPDALAHDGAIGVAGDPAKAAALYRLARDGGYPVPDQDARATRP